MLRKVDFEAFTDPVDKDNPLRCDFTLSLSYAVHGHWWRNDDDQRGIFGTWWMTLSELLEQLPEDVVRDLLQTYDAEVKEARDELFAIEDARREREEEGEGEGEQEA